MVGHLTGWRLTPPPPPCALQELSIVVKGFATLGYPLPHAWWDTFLATSADRLPSFTAGQLSNLVLGIAKTGLAVPPEWQQVSSASGAPDH